MTLEEAREKIRKITLYTEDLQTSQDLTSIVIAGLRLADLRIEMSMSYEKAVRALPGMKRDYRTKRESTAKIKRAEGLGVGDSEREGKLESYQSEWEYEVKDSEVKAWKMYIESMDVAINCVARAQRHLENERVYSNK